MSNIAKYTEVVTPRLYVEANNAFAEDLLKYITKFSYEEKEGKAAIVSFTLSNQYNRWTDDPRFKAGIMYRFSWGYPGNLSKMREVIITKCKPNFTKGTEVPTIEIVGFDPRFVIMKGSLPRNWGKCTSSACAEKIAKELGYNTDIEESKDPLGKDRVQTADLTPVAYLEKLAAKLNWDFYIEQNTLHFHKKRLKNRPVAMYTYYTDSTGTLLEFSPEIKMNKPDKAGVAGASVKDSKAVAATAGSKNNGDTKLGKAYVEVDVAPGGVYGAKYSHKYSAISSSTGATTKEAIQAQSAGASKLMDFGAVKAKMTVVGDPGLKIRDNIIINNVGRSLSGIWRISDIKHIIKPSDSVYVTEMELSRNALNGGKGSGDKNAKDKNTQDAHQQPDKAVINVNVAPNGTYKTEYTPGRRK